MHLRVLLVLAVLSLGSFAACAVDPPVAADPAPAESATTAAVSWDCASICFKGLPCHNICTLTPDEPGFAVVPGPRTCDSLREINRCGDGCCDAAEADRRDPAYCAQDCRIAQIDIEALDGKLRIVERDAVVGTVEPTYVAVAPACR